jgi:hypothetical protein
MRKIFLAFICLLTASMIAKANEALPQGIWEVEQITVDKSTDGKGDKKVYGRSVKVQSYISSPHKWEIKDSKTIVWYYEDGREETCSYAIEGDRLTIQAATAPYTYQYSIKEEKLTLRITHNYVNNLPSGRTEKINETWTLVLSKK